jgi:Subtilase family
MKKYLILCLSMICTSIFGQIAKIDSNRIIIHLPVGITPERKLFFLQLRGAFGVAVVDSLPRLQMEQWAFTSERQRLAFMAIWGQAAAMMERSVLTVSAPKKPRPRISEDTITAISANYWTQTFLRRCNQAGNTPVKVATIDCGIKMDANCNPQNALLNRYYDQIKSRNLRNDSLNACSIQETHPDLHGTRVAAVIATIYDSVGMNSAIQKITIFKAFNERGEAELWDILRAIDACIQQQMNIVNLSFNYKANLFPNTGVVRAKLLVETAINIAKNYNILFVTAAGNDGNDVDGTPNVGFFATQFECDNLIKVAADSIGIPASFTNYGIKSVDMAAPGIVVTQGRGDTLMISTGTSFAAPVVTAIAAIEASKLSSFDWWAVKKALQQRFRPTPAAWQGKLNPNGGVLKPICD